MANYPGRTAYPNEGNTFAGPVRDVCELIKTLPGSNKKVARGNTLKPFNAKVRGHSKRKDIP